MRDINFAGLAAYPCNFKSNYMYPSSVLFRGVTAQQIAELELNLQKVEAQLKKVQGCSPLTHGWQTQRLAKAQRKWDMLAQERRDIQDQIERLQIKSSIEMNDI